jgi:hypothetical protein
MMDDVDLRRSSSFNDSSDHKQVRGVASRRNEEEVQSNPARLLKIRCGPALKLAIANAY